jgi:hypothetical protein
MHRRHRLSRRGSSAPKRYPYEGRRMYHCAGGQERGTQNPGRSNSGRGIATLRVPRRGRQSRTRTRSHICCVARWDQLLEKAKQLEALVTERANAITQAAKGRQLHDERESHIRHIRQKNEGAVHRLSQRFDAVIRELVPGEIEGAVIIDGKGITLKVSQDGERSTLQLNRSRSWPLTLRRSSLLWRVPQLSLDFFCTTAPEKPT